ANMLEYPLFLKVGATSLMLSLLEERMLPAYSVRLNDEIGGYDGIRAFYVISTQENLTYKTLEIKAPGAEGWELVSPIELQARYLEAAQRYLSSTSFPSQEAENEAKTVTSMWQETLAALENNDEQFLFGRIDWFTKKKLIESALARNT